MTTLPLTTLPQLSDRGRVIVSLMQDCIAANWTGDEIMEFVENAADLVLGPSLAITPEVARALDLALSRTLNETAATRQTQGEGEGSRLEPAVQTAQTPSSVDGAGSDGLAVRKPPVEGSSTVRPRLKHLTLGNETRLPHPESPATATEAPHQDHDSKGDGGAVPIAQTGLVPPRALTFKHRNTLMALADLLKHGPRASITQVRRRSGEPSAGTWMLDLVRLGYIRKEGSAHEPRYTILRMPEPVPTTTIAQIENRLLRRPRADGGKGTGL